MRESAKDSGHYQSLEFNAIELADSNGEFAIAEFFTITRLRDDHPIPPANLFERKAVQILGNAIMQFQRNMV